MGLMTWACQCSRVVPVRAARPQRHSEAQFHGRNTSIPQQTGGCKLPIEPSLRDSSGPRGSANLQPPEFLRHAADGGSPPLAIRRRKEGIKISSQRFGHAHQHRSARHLHATSHGSNRYRAVACPPRKLPATDTAFSQQRPQIVCDQSPPLLVGDHFFLHPFSVRSTVQAAMPRSAAYTGVHQSLEAMREGRFELPRPAKVTRPST